MRHIVSLILMHPICLGALTLLVIGMLFLTGQAHFEALIQAFSNSEMAGDLELEEDIAVILVAFGVFLEQRGIFSVHKVEEAKHCVEEWLNEVSELFGAYMLMIGLVMETVDQCFEKLLVDLGLAKLGLFLMVAMDIAALIVCLLYIHRLFFRKEHA